MVSLPELIDAVCDSIGVDSLGIGSVSDTDDVDWASDWLAVALGVGGIRVSLGITWLSVALASVLVAEIMVVEVAGSGEGSKLLIIDSMGSRMPPLEVAEVSEADWAVVVAGSGAAAEEVAGSGTV